MNRRSFGPLSLVALCAACLVLLGLWIFHSYAQPTEQARLTFFSPQGYPQDLDEHTHFGMVNAASPEQVRQSLETAQRNGAQLQIDFSPILLRQRPATAVHNTYQDAEGTVRAKTFPPLAINKVKDFPADAEIDALLAPYWPVLGAYPNTVATIFLADEPYMHGISKRALERAAVRVRALLHAQGLDHTRLGVVFAGAMFDPGFARQVADHANAYVAGVDAYHERQQREALTAEQHAAHARWIEGFTRQRLTTYDLSGNLFLGGGIPKGFDIVAYDLYTATLLQDAVHDGTLDWFAKARLSGACAPFLGLRSQDLRQQFSFYRDGPVAQSGQAKDKHLLDQVFTCKSESILALLRQHAPTGVQAFQLWGEASANGFLEFDAAGRIEPEQPRLLVEGRVADEVSRTMAFYQKHRQAFAAGTIFFLYDDTIDHSINLHVSGAKAMPSVTRLVFDRIGKPPVR